MNNETTPAPAPLPVLPLTLRDNWQTFATTARAINAANGWGLEYKPGDVPGYIGLIHSEISEALAEVYRLGRDSDAPEALVSELADVVIRSVDLAELISPGMIGAAIANAANDHYYIGAFFDTNLAESGLLGFHSAASVALEVYRKADDWQTSIIVALARLAKGAYRMARQITVESAEDPDDLRLDFNDTTAAVFWGKLDKNARRAYRHGGLRS